MPPKKNTKRAKAPSALDRRGKKKVSILTQEKILHTLLVLQQTEQQVVQVHILKL